MSEAITQIHLVDDLQQAFKVAHDLEAVGIGMDMEGVLIPYIGNSPTIQDIESLPMDYMQKMFDEMAAHQETQFGIMTNNINAIVPSMEFGVVDWVANSTAAAIKGRHLPYVHKDMRHHFNAYMSGKPSGEQGKFIAEVLGIKRKNMVLIDDQGVKNAGEAVKADFKAIIVPNPVGFHDDKGCIIEHWLVKYFRRFEPAVYTSLRKRGNLAAGAYKILAGIELSQIADFVDHRSAA